MRKVFLIVAIAMLGAGLRPLVAQNPIQAAKHAYNKAKQQKPQQQQQKTGQQTKSGQPQQPQGGTPSNDTGPGTEMWK